MNDSKRDQHDFLTIKDFSTWVQEIDTVYLAGVNSGIDITHKRPLEKKVTMPDFELLAEIDVSVGGYFETTIRIKDYGGDWACYLGNTDISNEVPYDLMARIVEECKQ